MGVVYKAQDTNLDRTVALKFLAAHLLESEEHKQRFLREAKAAASLDHPNICMVHEVGEADGHVFLAMGYVDGPEVSAKIKERPLKLEEALDIAIQAAEGLRAAHQKGIVHRDIKSSNLMLTSQRPGEDHGLRPGTAYGWDPAHQDRHDCGYPGLHVAGTGAAAGNGSAHRHLVSGRGSLRDGDGPFAL